MSVAEAWLYSGSICTQSALYKHRQHTGCCTDVALYHHCANTSKQQNTKREENLRTLPTKLDSDQLNKQPGTRVSKHTLYGQLALKEQLHQN